VLGVEAVGESLNAEIAETTKKQRNGLTADAHRYTQITEVSL